MQLVVEVFQYSSTTLELEQLESLRGGWIPSQLPTRSTRLSLDFKGCNIMVDMAICIELALNSQKIIPALVHICKYISKSTQIVYMR